MWNKTESGWIMSLRNESNWGSVSGFLDDVRSSRKRNGMYILESDIYGTIQPADERPTKGQGIGFYHSTRAVFDGIDECPKRPRITLIGEILDIRYAGKELDYIKAEVDPFCLEAMEINPIMRDDNIELFEATNMKQSVVATLYYAAPDVWKEFLKKSRVISVGCA